MTIERQALKGETTIEQPTRAQGALGRRTAETRATVPDVEFGAVVDVTAALALCASGDVTMTAILTRACALALREHRYANAAYRDGRYELYSRVNIAVVLQTEDAPVAPTVLDADTKSLSELSAEIELLRARAAELTPPELAGSTFTLTDLTDLGVQRSGAVLTPPHAAALAAGAPTPAPVVRDGALVASHTTAITLACDGRILFGARAAAFLVQIAELLETAAT